MTQEKLKDLAKQGTIMPTKVTNGVSFNEIYVGNQFIIYLHNDRYYSSRKFLEDAKQK